MFEGIINLFSEIIETIINGFFSIYNNAIPNEITNYIDQNTFNIYLFSEKGMFGQPLPLGILMYLILFILLLVFLVRLLWKGTKKVISLVMGVFRL